MSMFGKHPKKWNGKLQRWDDFPNTDFSNDKIMTVQASKDEVDINKIVARVNKGLAVPVMNGEPFYGDVSEFGGLQDAIIKTQEADELFMQFPADVREHFENDPVKFVEFFADPANLDEARSLGLVVKPPEGKVSPPVTTPPVPEQGR